MYITFVKREKTLKRNNTSKVTNGQTNETSLDKNDGALNCNQAISITLSETSAWANHSSCLRLEGFLLVISLYTDVK